jgi:peroxisomal 3,2-trans-enoyl-CoA isomerase
MAEPEILISYRPKLAIITLNCPQKLNALSGDDIYITVLTGKGRFFSAGADVTFGSQKDTSSIDERQIWLKSFVANNLFITRAFYVRCCPFSSPYPLYLAFLPPYFSHILTYLTPCGYG